MAKVSVLVPIYNVAEYLSQCLQSIANQTFDDIEIVLVDDGSTDGSPELVDEYAASDARVKVIHKRNSGYGDSLNQALKLAAGEWVSIAEPDDWVDPHMLENLLNAVEAAAADGARVDIVKGSYWRVLCNAQDVEREIESVHSEVVKPPARPFSIDECPTLLHLHPSIWSALYNRAFLDEFGIRFLPIPGAGWADNPFFLETMIAARSIVWVPEPVYHYREFEDGTISHLKDWRIIPDRWAEMERVLEKYDVQVPSILEAHACRGCAYLQMLANDFEQSDELIASAKALAETISFDLVSRSSVVPKGYRFAYARYLSADKRSNLFMRWISMQVNSRLISR